MWNRRALIYDIKYIGIYSLHTQAEQGNLKCKNISLDISLGENTCIFDYSNYSIGEISSSLLLLLLLLLLIEELSTYIPQSDININTEPEPEPENYLVSELLHVHFNINIEFTSHNNSDNKNNNTGN